MNKKNLISIISPISVFVMFVWGAIAHSYEYSWLAVPAGGILIAILSMINLNKNKAEEQ